MIRMKLQDFPTVKLLDFDIPKRKLFVYFEGEIDKIEIAIHELDMEAGVIETEIEVHFEGAVSASKEKKILITVLLINFLFLSWRWQPAMIIISIIALAGNTTSLFILQKSKDSGVHMKASWIFTSNDIVVNLGVITAGIVVHYTASGTPDLIIGSLVFLLVGRGAIRIYNLSK